jgi:hypothetical protein
MLRITLPSTRNSPSIISDASSLPKYSGFVERTALAGEASNISPIISKEPVCVSADHMTPIC